MDNSTKDQLGFPIVHLLTKQLCAHEKNLQDFLTPLESHYHVIMDSKFPLSIRGNTSISSTSL